MGVLIGACIPFLFAALSLHGIERVSSILVDEIRRQLRIYPELKDTTQPLPPSVKADVNTVVRIVNKCTFLEILIPLLLAVFFPPGIGFLLSAKCLAGLLIGALTSGFMLSFVASAAGSLWNNAFSFVERGE